MKFGYEKKALRFSIIVRENSTNKTRSMRIDDKNIKSEKQLLDLIKDLLIKHFKEIELKEGLK